MPQTFLAQLKSPPSPTVLKGPPLNKQYPPSRGFENKTERSVTLHRLPTCGVPRLYRHWRHSCRCHMILGRLHHVRVVLRSLVTGELPLRLPCAFTGVVITSVRSGKQQQTTKEWVAGDCIGVRQVSTDGHTLSSVHSRKSTSTLRAIRTLSGVGWGIVASIW